MKTFLCTIKCTRKFALVMLMLLVGSGMLSAQTIKGTVKDSSGEAVIGATVQEKGGKGGTVTDFDGNFSLTLSGGKEIVISYVGMKTQTVNVSGKSTVNIVLEDEATALNDVVVIGYGTARKKDLTGSVATVKGQDLAKVPVANVSEALTGKMAGVQVTTTDGSPDAEILIRVRGGGSITGDNSPLYVVDGFQTSTISDISPNDIEDITVLKDASSTAIYGAQGANGVILITTKNAKGGRTTINYNGFLQTKTVSKRLETMDTYDYVMTNYEYRLLGGDSELRSFYRQFGDYDDLYLYKSIKPIDWQDDMFGQSVLSQSHNVSLNGGTEKTKFSISGTYDYNGGLMVNNDFSRYAFMAKLNHDINKNLKFSLKASVTDQIANGQGTQGGTYKVRTENALYGVATKGLSEFITPDFASMSDDEINEWQLSNMSLSEQSAQYWRKRNNRTFRFNGALDWKTPLKGLKAHVEGGYDYGFNEVKNWYGSTTTQASYVGGLPLADWQKTNQRTIRESANLNYDFKLNKIHHFNAMVGQEYRSARSDYSNMGANNFSKAYTAEDVFANFGSGKINESQTRSYVNAEDNTVSFFGRLNYTLLDRYLFTITFREDGSSKFADGRQWGFFPAAAASWRIVEEPWMRGTSKWLSNLKLRVSYGKVGNNKISNNTFQQLFQYYSGSKAYGVGETPNVALSVTDVLANPFITWEKRTTRNLGLDFGFFHERLSGNLDFYWNSTDDLLIQHSVAAPGYKTVNENSASTSNKGAELTLNAVILQKKNYSLNANFNIGFDKSNVKSLAEGIQQMTFQSGWASTDNKNQQDYIVRIGDPIGLVYGWMSDGYYTTSDFESYDAAKNTYVLKSGVPTTSLLGGRIGVRPGTMKLKDLNNDGVVDTDDITVIGDTNADFAGGFGLSGTLYDFDFNVNFTFTVGNDIYNANKIQTSSRYRNGTYPNMRNTMRQANAYSYMNPETGQLLRTLDELAYWNEGGNGQPAKEMWSPFSTGDAVVVPTDWAMDDASFLRLQSVTLGYTLPANLTKKFGVQRLRFYVTGANLFIITNYPGFDPEVSSYVRNSSYVGLTPGIDFSSYPKSRSFTFGVNVTL
ncbi:MAG: TonB-dependent receptor [Prevotella sp.]|nr:TonB-dependent receptor [Prevotella sp.]MBR1464163.1 TonB-dependent receptor [Prevotella sp.]